MSYDSWKSTDPDEDLGNDLVCRACDGAGELEEYVDVDRVIVRPCSVCCDDFRDDADARGDALFDEQRDEIALSRYQDARR